MVELFGIKLANSIERDLYEKALNFLPNETKDKIKRFRRYEDSLMSLTAELLKRAIVCLKLGINNESVKFNRSAYGKPYLEGHEDFHFNLSHSGSWVVCAVSSKPVGIDVEKIKEIDLDIAKRFFSKEEVSDLFSKNGDEKIEYFFELWTLKESYIKADGRGLSLPLNSFSFRIENDNIIFTSNDEPRHFFFKKYDIDKEYKFAVCSMEPQFPEEIDIKSFEEVFEFLLNNEMLKNS
ncbi:4'-phosphopantetheinyl transferase family protein [Acetivibrio straminisolvens]|uniref:4'-phosphopantetheinyl transferase family protein n=1 Tax=Acetivibrio straminisolvens TaxID=253314 RepID=UPI00223FC9EA|nr:4'-phosphopantetheinyl transferase superfamily protein [Acetivibrio straminisolvens]